MSNVNKTDTSLLDFIAQIPSGAAQDLEIMMYDTEPTPFGMGQILAFDIGYRPFSPFGGTRGEMNGGIVYEIVRNREMMTHLSNQSKISKAQSDEYFYIMKYLADEDDPTGQPGAGWFSNKIDNAPIYGQETRQSFLDYMYSHLEGFSSYQLPASVQLVNESNLNEMYRMSKEHLDVTLDSIAHFEGMVEQEDTTKARQENAYKREQVKRDFLYTLTGFIQETHTNQELVRSARAFDVNLHKDLRKIRQDLYKDSIFRIGLGQGLDYERDLEILKGLPGGTNIKPLDDIMKDYEKAFNGVVGVMGHNISGDLSWTRNTIDWFSDNKSGYKKMFDEEQIEAYCSYHFLKRLYSLEGTELLQTMFKLNGGEIYNSLKASIESGSLPPIADKERSYKLEALYTSIIDEDAKQPHSARGDVDWTIDIVQKVAEDMVRGQLTERK